MEPIQQKLRELEIAAHSANVPMDEVINLIERQFLCAALQRNKGNAKRVAVDMGRNVTTIYRMQRDLLRPKA